jgi:hypothetical protein
MDRHVLTVPARKAPDVRVAIEQMAGCELVREMKLAGDVLMIVCGTREHLARLRDEQGATLYDGSLRVETTAM